MSMLVKELLITVMTGGMSKTNISKAEGNGIIQPTIYLVYLCQ